MSLIKRNNGGLLPSFSSLPSLWSDFFDDRFFNVDLPEVSGFMPAVNIKESKNDFKLELSAPGFSKNDFKVKVEDDVMTISAEKKEEKEEKNERYARREFYHNAFSRSFTLPSSVKSEKVEAHYENGILQLVIPKKEEAKASVVKEVAIS
jgi:HSP20 family protein